MPMPKCVRTAKNRGKRVSWSHAIARDKPSCPGLPSTAEHPDTPDTCPCDLPPSRRHSNPITGHCPALSFTERSHHFAALRIRHSAAFRRRKSDETFFNHIKVKNIFIPRMCLTRMALSDFPSTKTSKNDPKIWRLCASFQAGSGTSPAAFDRNFLARKRRLRWNWTPARSLTAGELSRNLDKAGASERRGVQLQRMGDQRVDNVGGRLYQLTARLKVLGDPV